MMNNLTHIFQLGWFNHQLDIYLVGQKQLKNFYQAWIPNNYPYQKIMVKKQVHDYLGSLIAEVFAFFFREPMAPPMSLPGHPRTTDVDVSLAQRRSAKGGWLRKRSEKLKIWKERYAWIEVQLNCWLFPWCFFLGASVVSIPSIPWVSFDVF